jgi:hypothetical protein
MNRLVFDADIWTQLDAHLRTAAPSEDGAFLLFRAGTGASSRRLVVHDLLLPEASDAWEARGQHNLRPSGRWLSGAIGAAIETASGLAFVHSHPDTAHPADLSWIDQDTSMAWARTLLPTLQRPFASLVWTPNDFTGWYFHDDADIDRPQGIARVESIGPHQRTVIHPTTNASGNGTALDDRQQRALGEIGNQRIRDLDVAVVGLGGTGSPVAEILGRVGVRSLLLVDHDVVDDPSNLRRIVGSTFEDLEHRTPKVEVAARHLSSLGLVEHIESIQADVRDKGVAQRLLDADLVISTTDTHSSRALLNQLAAQYYLPVFDVGVVVGTATNGAVSGMPVDVRSLLPGAACLWCRGILDASRIRAENLPEDEAATLAREGYVQGLAGHQPSLAPLNYLAAGAVCTTALQLSAGGRPPPVGYVLDAWEGYYQPLEPSVQRDCICARWRGQADEVALPAL